MKKIGIIALVLVLALGSLGVGYSMWSEQLDIGATVVMAKASLAFDADEILSYVDNEVDKDVGWAEVYYDPASYIVDPHTGKDGYKTLVWVIHKAYPGYQNNLTTVVPHNIGNIPIHISDIILSDASGELTFVWTTPPPTTPALGFFWKDFNGNGLYDDPDEEVINVKIVNFVCIQLEPCESTKGEIDLEFKQPLEECHTYKFTAQIVGVQWNE